MVTLQHHVSSILDKSARAAAEEIIKLFDSSFEAFSEELHKRQEEIDTLRRKLEVAETELNHEDRSGPAYLCAQCGVSFNAVIPLEENHKAPDSDSSLRQDLEADLNDQTMDHAPIEEMEADNCIEFELPPEEDDSYSQLIQKDESTRHTETTNQEGPTHKEERAPHETTQKRGRGRPRKELAAPGCKVSKRGRGRPRKAKVSFFTERPVQFLPYREHRILDSDENLEFEIKIEQVEEPKQDGCSQMEFSRGTAEQNLVISANQTDSGRSQLWVSPVHKAQYGSHQDFGESDSSSGFEQFRKDFLTQAEQCAAAHVPLQDLWENVLQTRQLPET
ncbi:hypothetical protein MHYP_G00237590 [Metynnis hypsauchen]